MLEPRDVQRYRRELDAMISKAGTDDPEAFAAVVELLDQARSMLPDAARDLRAPVAEGGGGYSWGQLGAALGVSKQAAAKRFGGAR